jgi:hypothetical protein
MSVERPLSRPIVIVKNADSPITFPLARPLVRSNLYRLEFSITSSALANFEDGGTGTAYTVAAADPDGNTITYGLLTDPVLSPDRSLFNIDAVTGAVSFLSPPSYGAPVDADLDNVYVITVTANNTITTLTKQVSINVLNPIPAGAIQLRDGSYLLDRAGNNIQVRV